MAKFKFKGVGDQDEITLRGQDFTKGKAVDVDCDQLAAKLRALDYFEEVKTAAKKAPAKPAAKTVEPTKDPVGANGDPS